jgi:outer membrane lipoprotein-sorting protein
MRPDLDAVERCRVPCQTASRKLGRGGRASAPSQWELPILDSVNTPPILQRHPALRWLAPIGIACIAGLAVTGVFTSPFTSSATSTKSLPATTPAALIAAVQHTEVDGFSGIVVSHLSLGLPELPALGTVGDGTSFTALLSGSHTMRVWYGGPDRQRIALQGSIEETDVFRDGTQLWQWSSADRHAVHAVLPAVGTDPAPAGTGPGALASLTPLALARQALRAMEPSTRVEVNGNHTVADRSTYELVLTPRTPTTKVGEVRIAVDGQLKIPLGVQVFARGATSPAVDVAFTDVSFGQQAERNFRFAPPDDATVREVGRVGVATKPVPGPDRATGPERRPRTVGTGWNTVVETHPGAKALAQLRRSAVLGSLTPVSGAWGSGYLLDSQLVSALVTRDGRVLVGAVAPEALYAAAGRK